MPRMERVSNASEHAHDMNPDVTDLLPITGHSKAHDRLIPRSMKTRRYHPFRLPSKRVALRREANEDRKSSYRIKKRAQHVPPLLTP
jgi:hypothetical protein